LDTEKYKDKITEQMLGGRNAGVTGTPGSFVNNEIIPGAYPFEDFTDSSGREREGMKSIITRHLSR
jgi:protein-disulfide isomerase